MRTILLLDFQKSNNSNNFIGFHKFASDIPKKFAPD